MITGPRNIAWIGGRSRGGTAGSNLARGEGGAWMCVCCECCEPSGDEPITRTEESYRLCVSLSVVRCSSNLLYLQWVGRMGSEGERRRERKKERKVTTNKQLR